MNTHPTASARSTMLAVGLIAFLFSLQSSAGAAWLTESGGADMAIRTPPWLITDSATRSSSVSLCR